MGKRIFWQLLYTIEDIDIFWLFFKDNIFDITHLIFTQYHILLSLTLTYLGYFASLNSWGGGPLMAPPKISTMDGPINGTDTE